MLDEAMYHQALLTAQNEARANQADPYAWFNMGTNYAHLQQPELAASAFDQARRLGLPFRMLWYQFEIFQTYLAVGRYQDVIDLATATLQATGGLEELYYYRGLARQALGQADGAVADFQAALDYNPHFAPAARALQPS
jgi:tetratricopeptide (TPR) repeat protein